jgi:outer membrane lipoprotein-sorting protein
MKKYLFIVLFCVMPGVGIGGQVQIDTKEFADNGRIFSQIADSASRVKRVDFTISAMTGCDGNSTSRSYQDLL